MRSLENRAIPFKNAYWAIPGKLMAGEYPLVYPPEESRKRLEAMFALGIRQIIDLTEPGEIRRVGPDHPPYPETVAEVASAMNLAVAYASMPIRDFDIPEREWMVRILDTIDDAISADRPVYVHCWAGIGRTGTVVGCYLVRHGHPADIMLLDNMQQLRRHTDTALMDSPQSRSQKELIFSWKKGE